ncbi:helix-turn-helix domain-containing protein [Pseudoramibacter sp.]|uniref:helix-turn-helix domain-containing protein n=1 Tax=Pseudoramibacter sp. TaxID=2034862 RepID=UPI0034585C3D
MLSALSGIEERRQDSCLSRDEGRDNITTDVLLKICEALNCNINEIVETIPDDAPDQVKNKEEQDAT